MSLHVNYTPIFLKKGLSTFSLLFFSSSIAFTLVQAIISMSPRLG